MSFTTTKRSLWKNKLNMGGVTILNFYAVVVVLEDQLCWSKPWMWNPTKGSECACNSWFSVGIQKNPSLHLGACEKIKHISILTVVFGNENDNLLDCCFHYLMSTFRCLPLSIHDYNGFCCTCCLNTFLGQIQKTTNQRTETRAPTLLVKRFWILTLHQKITNC